MKYAIIENGKVANIAKADAPLADNWVPAQDARIGDLWDGQAFTPPAPPAPTREELHQKAKDAYASAMSVITDKYPLHEREGWPEQIEAAQAVIGGGASDLVDALAAVRGVTALEMANIIVQKRAEYQVLYAAMTANFQRLSREIDAANDLSAIDVNSGWDL